VIIEAAINGVTTKETNPNVPRDPDEIAADGLACIEAGAAIIHNHIDLYGTSEEDAAARYLEGWRPILAERSDALVYPTVHIGSSISYEHLVPLAATGILRLGIVDPGSVNLGGVDEDGVPTGGFVYANSYDNIARAFEICRDHGLGPVWPSTNRAFCARRSPGGGQDDSLAARWSSSTSLPTGATWVHHSAFRRPPQHSPPTWSC